jgi:hypothetical protein
MSDGSLLVQGLVETSARRDAIRQALKEVSGLRIEVYLPREIRTGFELYNAPDQSTDRLRGGVATSSATLADLSSAKMPLYERLYQHFSQSGSDSDAAEKQVAVFSNELVTLARQTFLHAWALKKLDREFSGERIANLPPAVQQKVEQMRQDHRRWVSTLAQRQSEMLSEVAGHEIAQAAGAVADGQQDSSELLRLAQEQNDLVRALFTTSQASSETTASLARLLVVLRRMGA